MIMGVVISGCGFNGTTGAGQAGQRRAAATTAPRTTKAGTASPAEVSARFRPTAPRARAPIRQLIIITAASHGATYAKLSAYQRARGRWRRVFGPWTARIGKAGLAPPGGKREGDLRTPSGTYGLAFMFGTPPDPGVAFRYRQSHPYDAWDDDPASPLYNEWVDERYQDPGENPEPMDVSGYHYGVVIAYNTARTPGLGSAIFLHVNIGTATTGCVTLPMGELLDVLRWLRPAQHPKIKLGVRVRPPVGH